MASENASGEKRLHCVHTAVKNMCYIPVVPKERRYFEMKKIFSRKVLGFMALALACVMAGAFALSAQPAQAANLHLTASTASVSSFSV